MKTVALSEIIRKQIVLRIGFVLFVLVAVISAFSVVQFNVTLSQIEKRIESVSRDLEDFTIGQILVDNRPAIDMKISDINQQSKGAAFAWHEGVVDLDQRLKWKFPFEWTYDYSLRSVGGRDFGHFHVSGSILSETEFVREFVIRIGLLVFFALLLGLALYPLATTIPKKFLLDPILEVRKLLDERKSDQSIAPSQITEINEIRDEVSSLLTQMSEASKTAALGELATQVVHDIRSPLSVLEVVVDDEKLSHEKRTLIRGAITTIQQVTRSLLDRHKGMTSKLPSLIHEEVDEVGSVSTVLDAIVHEILEQKRAQYLSRMDQITFKFVRDNVVSFAEVNPIGLKRVLSNLLDNSADATKSGTITVSLKQGGDKVELSVVDPGMGIPDHVLPKLGRKGFSYNKENGSGLGLFHAIQSIERWKGSLSIESSLGRGAKVTVCLPLIQKPSWFTDSFSICKDGYLIIVDDDDAIHERWHLLLKEKLSNLPRVFNLRSPEDLKAWVNLNALLIDRSTFLVDFNYLGSKDTGLELIERLKIDSRSVLVSSQDPSSEIIAKLQALNVQLMPKFAIGSSTIGLQSVQC